MVSSGSTLARHKVVAEIDTYTKHLNTLTQGETP